MSFLRHGGWFDTSSYMPMHSSTATNRCPLSGSCVVACADVGSPASYRGAGFTVSRASPPHRPREEGLAHPADTSRTNLAAALGLLSR
jgi:hypothetical protein